MIARLLAIAILATGCRQYAHVALRNAPANVDLGAPMVHENGDPARFDPGQDPGNQYVSIWAMPYIGAGIGREPTSGRGAGETGIELRFEYAKDQLLRAHAWAITAGIALAQWHDSRVTSGPIYAELDRRGLGSVAIDVGVGPAFYAHDPELGAQLTVRIAAIFVTRIRAMPNSGFEMFAGAELPVPVFFGWSR